jgi:lipid A ethanolaminephosphotransferase
MIKPYNAILFYVSDHEESLGEEGVYLHSLPNIIAPSSQRKVPLLIYMSPTFKNNHQDFYKKLLLKTSDSIFHDNVFHISSIPR